MIARRVAFLLFLEKKQTVFSVLQLNAAGIEVQDSSSEWSLRKVTAVDATAAPLRDKRVSKYKERWD